MRRIYLAGALLAAIALTGCADLQKKLDLATGVYTFATETTVPANVVIPVANSFDILKAGATNYGRYCIAQKMAPSVCSADTRRIVVKAVRSGTAARNQLKASLRSGEPAAASIFNVLVAAVNGLQASPAASAQFSGG
jgi:hypothetical protein